MISDVHTAREPTLLNRPDRCSKTLQDVCGALLYVTLFLPFQLFSSVFRPAPITKEQTHANGCTADVGSRPGVPPGWNDTAIRRHSVATDGSNYGAEKIFLEERQCFDCWSGGMQSLRN